MHPSHLRDEAKTRGHAKVTGEHPLLALLQDEENVAPERVRNLAVDLSAPGHALDTGLASHGSSGARSEAVHVVLDKLTWPGLSFESWYRIFWGESLMRESELLARITIDPERCGGRPCIRGLRVRVIDVLELLAAGETPEQILAEYPYLEPDDIAASLLYAARQLDHPVLAA